MMEVKIMWYENIFSVLKEYFDENRCYSHIENIYENDRWFDFKHFKKTAEYCLEQMKKAGLSEVEMLPLRADGKTPYGDWVIPRAWDAEEAVLMNANTN